MNPALWGKHYWAAMLLVAVSYPEKPSVDEMHAYRRFYEALMYVLPCESCAANYRRHLREKPIMPYLVSRKWLFVWLEAQYGKMAEETGKEKLNLKGLVTRYLPTGDTGTEWDMHIWPVLLSAASVYPSSATYEQQMHMWRWLESLREVGAPRGLVDYALNMKKDCARHYLVGREHLVRWVVRQHRMMTNASGEEPLSYDGMLRRYLG